MVKSILALQGVMLTTASAHPGPPGHIHGEEWPFGPLFVVAGVVIAFWAFRKTRAR